MAAQSTKPSIFLPRFRTVVAEALDIDERFVRIVAQPDPNKWSYQTGSLAAAIYLNPSVDLQDAGAGRYGTPVTWELQVIIRSSYLGDQAGGNESASTHFDQELAVVNAIHLQHINNGVTTSPLFIMPPRLISGGDQITRNTKLVGLIESVIRFKLDGVLAVTTT